MDKKDAVQIIEDNVNAENDSFLDFLHERDCFNEKSFWLYYTAVRQLGIDFSKQALPRELTAKVVRIYEYFLFLISCHFNDKDRCKIKNLPENYSEYYDRLRMAVKAYLTGNPIDDEMERNLNQYLKNECDK